MPDFPNPEYPSPFPTRSGYGFSFPSSDMFNSLLSRYGQAMDYQLQDMSKMPGRNEVAFNEWLKKREFEKQQAEHAQQMADTEATNRREAELRGMTQGDQAAALARTEEHNRALASVARAHAQWASVPNSAVPFSPEGAVADYYEYGAGSPQGRGGGGSTQREISPTDPCWANPRGPGCPEDPLRQGGPGVY